ncbi:MAG: anti-sigma factor [Candidatus Aminicenantaceae bacterium]
MNCPSADQIYSYLENELTSSENKAIEKHLLICLKCRKALEVRKFLLQAIETLPSWQVPSGFSQQVMDRIFPVKVSIRGWLTAFASGFVAFVLGFFIYVLATGQNLSSLLINLNQSLLEQAKSISLVFIKFFKLISVSLKIIHQLSGQFIKALTLLTTLFSPEVQIIIIIFTLILITFSIYGIGRKFLIGEKQ